MNNFYDQGFENLMTPDVSVNYDAEPERSALVALSDDLNQGVFAYYQGNGYCLSGICNDIFHALEENGVQIEDFAKDDFFDALAACDLEGDLCGILRVSFKERFFCLPIALTDKGNGWRGVELYAPMEDLDEDNADALLDNTIGGIGDTTHDDPEAIRIAYENFLWSAQVGCCVALRRAPYGDFKDCIQLYSGTGGRVAVLKIVYGEDGSTAYERIL